jgi:hypothetical protein
MERWSGAPEGTVFRARRGGRGGGGGGPTGRGYLAVADRWGRRLLLVGTWQCKRLQSLSCALNFRAANHKSSSATLFFRDTKIIN